MRKAVAALDVLLGLIRRAAEALAALLMAVMFLTFILQIAVRYSAPITWLADRFPFLEPSKYGWTLDFSLLLWVWLVFLGNALVVRERDHVTFDILYDYVGPTTRKWFAILAALAISVALIASIEPTWGKFYILRLKKTATLSQIFGDGIRMRHIYSVYFAFLAIVAARYLWRIQDVARHGAEQTGPHAEGPYDP
ncbi:MAG: TRAP transporter small permease subunit [Alphaproteobacteria bacterium]|nr:MAG: TRAP transporter small permease subunit [Alphaproteobacteria bacterium]